MTTQELEKEGYKLRGGKIGNFARGVKKVLYMTDKSGSNRFVSWSFDGVNYTIPISIYRSIFPWIR